MRIEKDKALFIALDYQKKLLPAISGNDRILEKSAFLMKCLRELGIPMMQTTQYAKGLGDNADVIVQLCGDGPCFDKTTFSIYQDPVIREYIDSHEFKYILIGGAETHICVLQSLIDLAEAGYQTVLVTDCVGSRHEEDKEMALRRAEKEGAILTTAEALVYELLVDAKNPHFKEISRLVKEQG